MSPAEKTNNGAETAALLSTTEFPRHPSEMNDIQGRNGDMYSSIYHLGNFELFRISLLIVAVALGLVSGSLYGFGRYASALRASFDASQPQVQSLGIWMDIGNYLGHPITGWIYDRLGPSFSCIAAAVILCISYSTIHHCVKYEYATKNSGFRMWWLLIAAFVGVGIGSGLGYIAGLGTVTKQFSGAWAVGWVAAGYGLSSTLVAWTYQLFGLSHMFAVWALLVGVVNIVGALAFRGTAQQQDDGCEPSNASFHPEQETVNTSSQMELDRVAEGDRRQDVGSSHWATWQKHDFWFLFLSFASVTGCGLFVINNVSSFVQSRGLSDSFAGSLVIFLSACNVSGRVLVGMLVKEEQNLEYLRGAALLMTIGLSASALLDATASLVCTVGCVATAYGASWVLLVGVLKEWYGKEHFGKDYGVIAMGPAVSGLIFNSLSAAFYQQRIEGDTSVCTGAYCFRRAFAVTASAALLGCLALSLLISTRRSSATI